MTRIERSGIRLAAAAMMALAVMAAAAEARGFGGGYSGGAIGPRIGAWGRPLGPVRPGPGLGWRGPGYAFRHPGYHRHWRGGYGGVYGYGLGGLGLGFGLGGLWGGFGDPFFDDGYVYAPPAYAPPVDVAPADVPPVVEAEDPADLSASVAACARRFRTYDPATQTYIGKGYVRRHCP
ncbi:BA14K family protein [Methylobacterium sp. WL18]|uniref:BA14K family protein n=1 Tax=Methylobacterium sp. WL18 TaxID=2603897 RepID=UPI0011C8803F|nr:BA14K family protein [Methylobacterium sp. WL18]TXN72728.1 BA14K family protein [Methylobacterium sp. WL18]